MPRLCPPFAPRALALLIAGLAGGCVTVERQSGALPDWARARAVELQGQGYPSLAAVPEKPTGLPDLPEWIARRDQLVSLNERMAASPCAIVPETNAEEWARATGGPVAADPRGEIPKGEDPAAWAKRQLALVPPAPPRPPRPPKPKPAPVQAPPAAVVAAAPSPDTPNDIPVLQNPPLASVCL